MNDAPDPDDGILVRSAPRRARQVEHLLRQWEDLRCLAVLDVGCGDGQHLEKLAEAGFERLSGIDDDPAQVDRATARLGDRARIQLGDLRTQTGTFHGIAAFFGGFATAGVRAGAHRVASANPHEDPRDVVADLRHLAGLLASGGRLTLDLVHRDFFPLEGELERWCVIEDEWIGERAHLDAGRSLLYTRRTYRGAYGIKSFSWVQRVFTVAEISDLLCAVGLRPTSIAANELGRAVDRRAQRLLVDATR